MEDIHNYNLKYERALKSIDSAPISEKNKKIIKKFNRSCTLEGLSKPRRMKLIGSLIILARDYLKKDFDKATKDQLKDVVLEIGAKDNYSVWTKQSYRAILKKFYKWLEYGDDYKTEQDYPKIISWINTNIKKKDQPKVQVSEILTDEEIKKLIDVAEHPRDKAFISMLYELGARIGEIGNLRVKDITKDKYSFLVDLNGKTGRRTPRIVISSPYITTWLNTHPDKENPDAPLWVLRSNGDGISRMQYQSLRALVLRLSKKAKIKKRIHPHLFRHSRVTHLLTDKQINEAQAKVYFGWTPSSKMLSEYSHLVSNDVNNAILEMHGIKTTEDTESKLKPKLCAKCGTINAADAMFCNKCASILDVKTAILLDEKRNEADKLVASWLNDPKVLRVFVEKARESGFGEKIRELL